MAADRKPYHRGCVKCFACRVPLNPRTLNEHDEQVDGFYKNEFILMDSSEHFFVYSCSVIRATRGTSIQWSSLLTTTVESSLQRILKGFQQCFLSLK